MSTDLSACDSVLNGSHHGNRSDANRSIGVRHGASHEDQTDPSNSSEHSPHASVLSFRGEESSPDASGGNNVSDSPHSEQPSLERTGRLDEGSLPHSASPSPSPRPVRRQRNVPAWMRSGDYVVDYPHHQFQQFPTDYGSYTDYGYYFYPYRPYYPYF